MSEPLLYRLNWRSGAVYPGAHPGQMTGAGQLFKRHEPLIASPDPRRIDLRASVLDPFGSYRVRVYQQQSTVNVYLVADLSASMGFIGRTGKQQTLVQFLFAVAGSALSYGDKFGFIGCNDSIEQRWLLPACQQAGRVTEMAQRLERSRFTGASAGLLQAATYLTGRRSLVFLLSDFHFPLPQLSELLRSLQAHDIVPLALWDQAEYASLPDWGLVSFQDMENKAKRTLFMRPALRRKIIAAYEQRQQDLKRCFRSFGIEPLFMTGSYNVQQINRYMQQRVA